MKTELYERVVIPTVTYAAQTLPMRIDERRKLDVAEIKC